MRVQYILAITEMIPFERGDHVNVRAGNQSSPLYIAKNLDIGTARRGVLMRPIVLFVVLGFGLTIRVQAVDPVTKEDRIKAVKGAVAVVEVTPAPGQKWRVPAFGVGRSGYFVTSRKSLPLAVGQSLTFTLPTKEKGAKPLQGVVAVADDVLGFTLFRAQTTDTLPVVPMGDDAAVGEQDDLTAFGLSAPKGGSPSGSLQPPTLTVTEQKVSVRARVLDADKMPKVFELDAPGADGQLVGGGPVVNATGEVIGLLTADPFGRPATTPAPVLSLRAVSKHLQSHPFIEFDPPEVDPQAKLEKASFRAGVLCGLRPQSGVSVELVVRSGGRERRVEMKPVGDGYETAIAPFEKTVGPEMVTAEIFFPDSTPRLPIADRTFTVGGKEVLLSDVTRVRFGKNGGVVTRAGRIDGDVSGLDELSVRTGGQSFTLKTATAREVRVLPPADPKNAYRLAVVVSREGKEVGRAEAVRFPKGLAPTGVDALRVGLLGKPKAAEKPTSYLRWLDLSDPSAEVVEYPAERLGLRYFSRQVLVSAYLPGVKPPSPQATHQEFQAAVPVVTVHLGNTTEKDLVAGTFGAASSSASITSPALTLKRGGPLETGQGKFVVHEVEIDRGTGGVKKLAADFIFYPGNDRTKPVVGVIRFNSQFE